MSFYEELIINQAINAVLLLIASKDKRGRFKAVLLKIRNKINESFPNE